MRKVIAVNLIRASDDFQHYGNEYTYLEKLNRELKERESPAKQPQSDAQNGIPKIEGPVLIEFHADRETDDDDYSL